MGKVVRHGEQVDQRLAHGAILALDLGQDFDAPLRDREDADGLPRLQPLAGAGQNGAFGQLQPPGRALGEGVEPVGFVFAQAPLRRPAGSPTPGG